MISIQLAKFIEIENYYRPSGICRFTASKGCTPYF